MSDLERFLELLWEPGDVREVRVPKHDGRNTASGYFDAPGRLAADVATWDGRANLYLTLNPVDPALMARAQGDRIDPRAAITTSDADIVARRWLAVDVDPDRPSGVSATDDEREAALTTARAIAEHLHAQGWGWGVVIDSGNGYWLLYRVDLPNDDDSRRLVEGFLRYLAGMFGTPGAKVDQTIGNAARIGPLVGTLKVKGRDLPDRPHRRTGLVHVPEELVPVAREKIARLVPPDAPRAPQDDRAGPGTDPGWVARWLDHNGVSYREKVRNGQAWLNVESCPWHPDEDPFRCGPTELPGGMAVWHGMHDRCKTKTWRDYREAAGIEPPPGIVLVGSRPGGRDDTSADEAPDATAARRVLVPMDTVTPERVSWLWQDRIALGKLAVVDGDPDQGKSTMTMDLGARVTRGWAMPDGSPGIGPAGVVILSAEDGLGDTIRPRLEAAGADLARVHALTAIIEPGDHGERLPALPVDVAELEAAATETGALMVIIDPLMAYLGGDVNAHRDQDVRRALAPLAAMGERTGAAVVVVRHLNKQTGGSAIYRGGGSIGIGGAARSVLLVAPDPDGDPDDPEPRRIVAVVKSNLARKAPAIAYRLVDDPDHGCARVRWEGVTGHHAADLLAAPASAEDRTAQDEAADFLREQLAAGPVASRDLLADAKAAGIAERTLHRAKSGLGIKATKVGKPGGEGQHWVWAFAPKIAKDAEDRHTNGVAAFGDVGSLRDPDDLDAPEPPAAARGSDSRPLPGDRVCDCGAVIRAPNGVCTSPDHDRRPRTCLACHRSHPAGTTCASGWAPAPVPS